MQSNIMLLITAFIWGSAFVAQSAAMDHLGPFAFNGIRLIVGCIALLPAIYFLGKLGGNKSKELPKTAAEKQIERKVLIMGGISCGMALFVASSLQQIGLSLGADAGKSGFITSLYIVIVPIFGIFLGKKVRPIVWLSVALGALGLYLLSIKGDLTFETGDFFVFLCAFAFSAHILIIDHFSPKTDGVKLSCIQFLFSGIACLIVMCFTEIGTFTMADVWACAFPILYAGVMSSGVAYTLQILAQKHAEPSIASLLMSLESVFAVICGFLILNEVLNTREIFGCIIMFVGVILAQLPSKEERLMARAARREKKL